ncbi:MULTISPECIES: ThiF family adenylyltransferase [Brevibacillus]|jgi:adenylyltransferase/sulfurtransferase|uniref:Molybdopterin biosynthesis protein MoeB n=1 Tax=Brevibacillus borstelensis AK1 TaxID=1300222 RepID=M8D9N5_9BACL|nr:ThiF family adenylyltransferase [Brevibacillus borstelensis]EMT52984.1 molybdopterin biosynthesis protein MoeB [Brevibacillus borstelensis AK1]KKX55605.1 thiamine biosynthesis protein ThiF [Brevibacillus borstelensis cifa_chp40]MBE5397044.1 ThiF family adenylyltransferase [Brevibacillus borstelensis]NOU55752.1 thiazole biosynthesis adenylyltransferase ThiF [Brevibacillus borstelensis]
MNPDWMQRYSRQMLFAPIGSAGQNMLQQKKAAVVGMGALGTVLANHLARAGVGYLRLIDRDFVEESNLQRQMLYDEADARQHLPKAVAATAKLRRINADIAVEGIVADISPVNAEALLTDVDVILDGTDNFQIRYLINDVAVKHSIPWVYGGVVSARGMFSVIRPGITPCFRCLFPTAPAGRGETCDTVGVIGPIVHIVASYQATEALKLLIGADDMLNPHLEQLDIWENDFMQMNVANGRNPACPACVGRSFSSLEWQEGAEEFAALCGRDTVQISPQRPLSVNLDRMAERFRVLGRVEANPFLLRFHVEGCTLVFFQDGRVLIQGTDDIAAARRLYAKYVGH